MRRSMVVACAVMSAGCRIGFEVRTSDEIVDGALDGALDKISGDGMPADGMAPARISWVKPFVQRQRASGTTDTFSVQAAAGNAIVLQVACADGAIPSAVTVSAPGWTFMPLDPLFKSPTQTLWAASFGAIAPNAGSAVVTVTWTIAACSGGLAELGDEFTNTDPTGGAVTFDAHTMATGSGDCSATLITGHASDAVWGACLSVMVSAVGSGYTLGANDNAGGLSEYKLTTDPAGTSEIVTFANPAGFLLSAVAIKPR